jgi:hypothetical protein
VPLGAGSRDLFVRERAFMDRVKGIGRLLACDEVSSLGIGVLAVGLAIAACVVSRKGFVAAVGCLGRDGEDRAYAGDRDGCHDTFLRVVS